MSRHHGYESNQNYNHTYLHSFVPSLVFFVFKLICPSALLQSLSPSIDPSLSTPSNTLKHPPQPTNPPPCPRQRQKPHRPPSKRQRRKSLHIALRPSPNTLNNKSLISISSPFTTAVAGSCCQTL